MQTLLSLICSDAPDPSDASDVSDWSDLFVRLVM